MLCFSLFRFVFQSVLTFQNLLKMESIIRCSFFFCLPGYAQINPSHVQWHFLPKIIRKYLRHNKKNSVEQQ